MLFIMIPWSINEVKKTAEVVKFLPEEVKDLPLQESVPGKISQNRTRKSKKILFRAAACLCRIEIHQERSQ